MPAQIDALASRLEAASISVDLDGDGAHLELLGFEGAAVFIELSDPNRERWPTIWDGCTLHVRAINQTVEQQIRRELLIALVKADIIPSIGSA